MKETVSSEVWRWTHQEPCGVVEAGSAEEGWSLWSWITRRAEGLRLASELDGVASAVTSHTARLPLLTPPPPPDVASAPVCTAGRLGDRRATAVTMAESSESSFSFRCKRTWRLDCGDHTETRGAAWSPHNFAGALPRTPGVTCGGAQSTGGLRRPVTDRCCVQIQVHD
ncbi:hypothetical protein EYF80_029696 [Liparis tanakae]|uniref:Uncharacterized protein n=1 Tax=Liparis tanakae TaxID=230148 RepID=A0A4Z2H5M8_9TELE|nr:hypothetical protein EYF80_029696 [Liparis tanakae]